MPLREFKCPGGHVTERLLLGVEDKTVKRIVCGKCDRLAERLEFSVTAFSLRGNPDGYHKPSPHANHPKLSRAEKRRRGQS